VIRPDNLWDHADPFFITVTVAPAAIDSYGHVNNTVYIGWLEQCAWAHSAAVGFPEEVCVEMARGMAVRNIKVDYLDACFEGDRILVGNWLIANNKLRAVRRFQLINETRDRVVMRGEILYVCMNLDTGRPIRMPPEFVDAYVISALSD
jgi:acyl-CoA thioester hydrolase